MSTKGKGKEILQETPKFSESEWEAEPEISPSSSIKEFSVTPNKWGIAVDGVMAQYEAMQK